MSYRAAAKQSEPDAKVLPLRPAPKKTPSERAKGDGAELGKDPETWERLCKIATEWMHRGMCEELPEDTRLWVRWFPKRARIDGNAESTVRVYLYRGDRAWEPLCTGYAIALLETKAFIALHEKALRGGDPGGPGQYICDVLSKALRAAFVEAKKGLPA